MYVYLQHTRTTVVFALLEFVLFSTELKKTDNSNANAIFFVFIRNRVNAKVSKNKEI